MKNVFVFLILMLNFIILCGIDIKHIALYNVLTNTKIEQKKTSVNEGFLIDTKVKTKTGYVNIQDLKINDFILGYDPVQGYVEKRIINVYRKKSSRLTKITFNDNQLIIVAAKQKFFSLYRNDWICAEGIKPNEILYGLNNHKKVLSIESISEKTDIVIITVEDHSLFVTEDDIVVHNADALKICSVLLTIGRVILKNPIVEIISKTLDIANICLCADEAFLKYKCESGKNKPVVRIAHFDQARTELYKLLDDLKKIKQSLEQIIKLQLGYPVNLTSTILDSVKIQNNFKYLKISIEEEVKYNQEQKENLAKVRQEELNQLKKQIIELQVILAYHFNELINSRNRALNEFNNILNEINKSINTWNANLKNISTNLAVYQYENIHIKVEEILKDVEIKNKELKLAIQIYKSHHNVLNKTSNINEIIKQEEKTIIEVDDLIIKERSRNIKHQKVVEHTLLIRNININILYNNILPKIKNNRQASKAKELADALKNKPSIQFSPKDPKKDDEEKSKISICEKSAKHIFRYKEGHLKDTPQNRKLLIDLVSDKKNFTGKDKYGNHWYSRTISNNKQLWASVRNNLIRDGGLNKNIRTFNVETGLCQLVRPQNKNVVCKNG